ncbi:MAG: hypothetical protein AMXMBFR45_24950 [Gammaproteobacteria bacterium]|nr:hypothetical protein [Gammaproteobacteria bacterium]GIK35181.1 MAG: hypothetical protein BroJett010_17400 [Gammaproteobacteria bacterium]
MGSWTFAIAASMFLVLLGLVTHWSLVVLGAALLVWPVLSELIRRRRGPPA